ncbi:MAG: hypothetical protein DRG63_12015 [Deltaproteobacteria bacterium]|nr:MAG: hypothetical protein DRG63_12015 [Deltaproteobacteria bacterium]
MGGLIEIFIYGKFDNARARNVKMTFVKTSDALPLGALLERVGIPPESIQLVMVNHRAVPKNIEVCPGDRVTLFGQEYPVFADWLSQREANILRMPRHLTLLKSAFCLIPQSLFHRPKWQF